MGGSRRSTTAGSLGPNSSQASSPGQSSSSRSARIIVASQRAPVVLRTIVVSIAMMQLRMNCKMESDKAHWSGPLERRLGEGRAPPRTVQEKMRVEFAFWRNGRKVV
ncbi:hypothetical protein CC_2904 [Caulobacter vibrioides CB15]|uniref:Uncharacterized protein n=1 Tax=Caulobacter vibrioides (strain ATCC 19089 / CIP 103742 / CB 15) TaxID=190650 RepID=Q9A4D2_CAUVC|nr:hypothetical protein CC_2904 [Caulobacter vibrioides CB15]ATC29735.1 hypothetical protein CA607_15645 [Caulobacter vibrioides]